MLQLVRLCDGNHILFFRIQARAVYSIAYSCLGPSRSVSQILRNSAPLSDLVGLESQEDA